jgi:hypothetical protein
MEAQDSKFQSAELELKQLMEDLTRAMGKAQAAIAKVTAKPSVDDTTASMPAPHVEAA